MGALPAETLSLDDQVARVVDAAQRLADRVTENYHESVRKRIRVSAQHNLRASSFGYKCDRRLYHDVVDWKNRIPHEVWLQRWFDRGNDMEPLIERKLAEAGLRIIGQQNDYFDETYRVSGHIDGYTMLGELDDGTRITIELKSTVSPNLLSCKTVEDLRRFDLGQRYFIQSQWYMHFQETLAALLWMWDGMDWQPVPVVIPYDVEAQAEIQNRAILINEHIEHRDPPPYIQDARQCKICPHFGVNCHPPISFGKGAQFITGDEAELLIPKIERHRELAPVKKEFDALDREIKGRFKSPDKDDPQEGVFIVGPYEIRREVSERKGYSVGPSKPQKITIEKVGND